MQDAHPGPVVTEVHVVGEQLRLVRLDEPRQSFMATLSSASRPGRTSDVSTYTMGCDMCPPALSVSPHRVTRPRGHTSAAILGTTLRCARSGGSLRHQAWGVKSSRSSTPDATACRGLHLAMGLEVRASLHMVLGTHRMWGNQLLSNCGASVAEFSLLMSNTTLLMITSPPITAMSFLLNGNAQRVFR